MNRRYLSPVNAIVWFLILPSLSKSQTCYDLLARSDSLLHLDKPDSAFVVAKLALARAEEQFGPSDTAVARIAHRVGQLGFYTGLVVETMPYFERAVTIRERVLGPDHPDVAESVMWLGFGFVGTNRFDKLFECLTRSQAIMEKNYGHESKQVAKVMNMTAQFYHDLGRFDDAERLYRESMVIIDKVLSPEDSGLLGYLNTFSGFLADRGDYANAVPMVERALAICEREWGKDHSMTAGNRANLATMYISMGNCEIAEQILRGSIIIGESSFGVDSWYVRGLLDGLADALICQGRFSEAEPLLRRSISIHEKTEQKISQKPGTLNQLAFVCMKQGKNQEAIELLLESLAIAENNPAVSSSVEYTRLLLAEEFHRYGREADADSLFRVALAAFERMYGPESPPVADALESFTHVFGTSRGSMEMSARSLAIREKNFENNVSVISEKDALKFSQSLRTSIFNYLSRCNDAGILDGSSSSTIGNIILSSKVQVSDGVFERRNDFYLGRDSIGQNLWNSLRRTRVELAHLYVQGPKGKSLDVFRKELDSLTRLSDKLETQLSRQNVNYASSKDRQKVTTERVASLLPNRATLIEYLKYDYLGKQSGIAEPHYLALVLDRSGKPFVRILAKAETIDSLISRYRQHFLALGSSSKPPMERDQSEYSSISHEIYNLVLKPIESCLKSGSTLFIAPDGGLNLVSFAGLLSDDGKYLIEQHPLHYLSAGRDLIRLEKRSHSGKGFIAFGDPDYEAPIDVRISEEGEIVSETKTKVDPYALRNVRSGCGTLSDMNAPPLPGTRNEVQSIQKIWKESVPAEASAVYVGPLASEELFKSRAAGKRVIHLATHGYFLQGECRSKLAEAAFPREYIGENPLLQSGIFLSGANLHGKGAEEAQAEDGIVTALEVTGMDLRGTDVVVLSACETGLGKVNQGEGVYGLRRAFLLSGAKTVVSSLWQIPDGETMKFMQTLYTQKAGTYPELLQKTMLRELNDLRTRKRPTHPYTWGAFVATGDWRRN